MPAQRERPPWPMKWIVLAIVLVLVPYTFLTLHFRKPGRMYEPYHDMKDRANTLRLLSAGFQRVTVEADRPADPLPASATAPVLPAPGGLPAALAATLLDQPLLPAEIVSVVAPPVVNSLFSTPLEFTCTVPDHKRQPAGAELYVRAGEIYIVPNFERLTGSLLARTREHFIRLTVPAGALRPGRYHVTLIGERRSRSWMLEVK